MSHPWLFSHAPSSMSTSSSSPTYPTTQREHSVHPAHLQAPSVDKLRHQESLRREDLQSGGNPRTTTPTQNVHLPTRATEQIPLTPTVDMKNTATFNVRTMDDNDEPWETEADHRTGWNKEFKSGTYRGMLYGIVLGNHPKQVVSLAKANSVSTNMRGFLSWAQRHYRIDVTTSTVDRKTGGLASAGACPGGCKDFSHSPRSALPPPPSPLHQDHKGTSWR